MQITCNVPLSFQGHGTSQELERLEAMDIIEKTNGPRSWVSPVVLVLEPHNWNSITLCRHAVCKPSNPKRTQHNTDSRRHHHCPQRSNCFFFPNRISRKGIPNSSYMKTQRNYNLSTYSGLFRYKRLTFRVNFAAEVFQNFIPQSFSRSKRMFKGRVYCRFLNCRKQLEWLRFTAWNPPMPCCR